MSVRFCGDVPGAAAAVREGIAATDAVGVARTYGGFVRANGVVYNYELGDWVEANRLAEESIAQVPAGLPLRRYGLARWVSLLVSQGDPRAASVLDELRGMVEGFPLETQFATPFHLASAESDLWRGDPDAAFATTHRAILASRDREWPRDHLRLYRVGMRAAAERAEVARARRDRRAERVAVDAGGSLWEDLGSFLESAHGDRSGAAGSEVDAEVSMIEAERRRLVRQPAIEAWLDAAERWRARENPYLVAYCRWREAEARLNDGDRPGATAALLRGT